LAACLEEQQPEISVMARRANNSRFIPLDFVNEGI